MSNQTDLINYIKYTSGQSRILSVPRIYVEITGSHRAGLFLSQCIFWSDRSYLSDGWFYKSFKHWKEELILNQHAVETCVNRLSKLDLIETKLDMAAGANVTHYRVNFESLRNLIVLAVSANSVLAGSDKTVLAENYKTSIAKTTTKTTTKDEKPSSDSSVVIPIPDPYLNKTSNSKNTQHPESKTLQIHYDEWGNEIDLKDLPAPASQPAAPIFAPPQEVILESKGQKQFTCPFCDTKQPVDFVSHYCIADGCHADISFMLGGKLMSKSVFAPRTVMAKLLKDMTSKKSFMVRWTSFESVAQRDEWEKLEALARKDRPDVFEKVIDWMVNVANNQNGLPKNKLVPAILKKVPEWSDSGSKDFNSRTPSKPKRTSAEIMREQDEYMKRTRGEDE